MPLQTMVGCSYFLQYEIWSNFFPDAMLEFRDEYQNFLVLGKLMFSICRNQLYKVASKRKEIVILKKIRDKTKSR